MAAKTSIRLHPTQVAYLTAKAEVELLRDECAKLTGPLPAAEASDNEWDNYSVREMNAREMLKMDAAEDVAYLAGDLMLEWAQQHIANDRRFAQVAMLWEKAAQNIVIREKLIAIVVKLDPRG